MEILFACLKCTPLPLPHTNLEITDLLIECNLCCAAQTMESMNSTSSLPFHFTGNFCISRSSTQLYGIAVKRPSADGPTHARRRQLALRPPPPHPSPPLRRPVSQRPRQDQNRVTVSANQRAGHDPMWAAIMSVVWAKLGA